MTEYESHAHAMQSGVAYELENDPSSATPKHLRVGVNAAMADQCGLVELLIFKGVITHEEYVNAITKSMKDEADRYRQRLSDCYGVKIDLA